MQLTRFLSLLFFVTFSITACKPKVILNFEKPELFLTEKQMQSVLYDAQLAEGAITSQKNKGKNTREIQFDYYNLIFQRHGITKQIFEDNLLYYNQFPELMEKIYDEIFNELTKQQSLLQNQPEE